MPFSTAWWIGSGIAMAILFAAAAAAVITVLDWLRERERQAALTAPDDRPGKAAKGRERRRNAAKGGGTRRECTPTTAPGAATHPAPTGTARTAGPSSPTGSSWRPDA